jgi:hypothetical protein
MLSLRSIALTLTLLPLLTTSVPVSTSSFTGEDWPTNVVMLGGSQTYGAWIPPDGTWYYLSAITCLDMPAYATGPCDSPTIDQIGVASGNGPCSFVGINGWGATLSGEAGEGYETVGPPQRIVLGKCGSSSS